MFTGIVEEVGVVERLDQSGRTPLTIRCTTVREGTRIGDSIAVNGVCLTVAELTDHAFRVDVQPVTLRLSNLGRLRTGDPVNMERSLGAGQRMGGHYVQGHVDGVGRMISVGGEGASVLIRIGAPPALLRSVVERGFVAVDGASLTVVRLHPDGFDVSLVYHTRQVITLPSKRPGALVNIENDVFGKYVERLASSMSAEAISLESLRGAGFA